MESSLAVVRRVVNQRSRLLDSQIRVVGKLLLAVPAFDDWLKQIERAERCTGEPKSRWFGENH
jgi:hypothetical protein